MLSKLRIFSALAFFASICLANPALAVDYTNTDLSSPVSDATDYTNVTISNNRTLSSGSLVGGYVYLPGTLDGDINVTNDGSITSTHSNYGVFYFPNVGNSSTLKTLSITNNGSLITNGQFAISIYILGKTDGSFPSFTRRSFDFSLDNSDTISSAATAVYVVNGDSGSSTITNSGTISSSTNVVGYKVIALAGGATSTIDNTGMILANSASDNAIDVSSTDSFINNTGSGSITGIINASGGSSTSLTVTNNSTDGITGNIVTTSADLDVINDSGTITGDINLGNHADSSVEINGGTIAGNITMNNALQLVTFGGGVLNGNVNGAGIISVNSNTVTNGNIGASTSLTGITIANSRTLNALTNNNSIRATNITLGSGAVLSMGDGTLTGTVDGSSTNVGTVNMTFSSNSDVNAVLGSANGLAAVNFTADSSAIITAKNSITAANVNISGIDGALILDPSVGITGNAIIGHNSNLLMGNGSFVTGVIRSATDGNGTLQMDGDFTVNDEIGTASNTLGNVTLMGDSTLTTSAAMRASTISIGSNAILNTSSEMIGDMDLSTNATLNLQDGATFFGNINPGGIVEEGIVNTSGLVVVEASIGDMGSIKAINVASGSQLRIANSDSSNANTIDALDVNITGQLDLIDATAISGDVTMFGASSKLNLSGYSHTINGNFATASGSWLYSTIHSSSLIDSLTISGNATIDANTKLSLTLGSVTPGSSYTLISGGAGSTINLITDNNIDVDNSGTNRSGIYLFTTSISGDDLLLLSSRMASFAGAAVSGQQNSVATALETIAEDGTDSGNMTTFINALFAADPEDMPALLDSVTPQVDNSIYEASAATNSIITNIFGGRLNNIRNFKGSSENRIRGNSFSFAELSKGFENIDLNKLDKLSFGYDEVKKDRDGHNDFWVKAFGSSSAQDNKNGIVGFDARTRGIALGMDRKFDKVDSRVGIGFTYGDSDIDSYDINKNNDAKTYAAILYGSKSINENLYIDALASAGINSYKTSRFIPAGSVFAYGDFKGQTYLGKVSSGYIKPMTANSDVVPNLGLTYALTKTDDYTETGAGVLNLNVRSDDINMLQPKAGVDFNFYDIGSKKYKLDAQVRLGYAYDLFDNTQTTTSTFSGIPTPFRTEGPKTDRNNFLSGIGIKYMATDKLSIGSDINYEFNQDYNTIAGYIGLKYGF